MTPTASRKNDMWIWMVLHFSFIIAIPVVLSVMSSCIKKPELKSADLGSEVESSEIEKVIGEIVEASNPYSIREGQAVHIVANYRVETSELVEYQELIQQVTKVIDDQNEFTVIFDQTLFDLDGEKPPVMRETVESELNFYPRPQADNTVAANAVAEITERAVVANNVARDIMKTQSIGRFSPEIYKVAGKTNFIPYADREYIKSTLHSFKVTKFKADPPPAVRRRPNCGDVPGCKIDVTQLEYEEAFWYSEAEFDKVTHQIQISLDVPYLGKVILDCSTAQQFIGDRDYVVRRCNSLYDFIY